jgi:hypothetical protein
VRNGLRKQVDRSGNDGENVVEVVQNAAGKLADDCSALKTVPPRLVGRRQQRFPMSFLKVRRRLP